MTAISSFQYQDCFFTDLYKIYRVCGNHPMEEPYKDKMNFIYGLLLLIAGAIRMVGDIKSLYPLVKYEFELNLNNS